MVLKNFRQVLDHRDIFCTKEPQTGLVPAEKKLILDAGRVTDNKELIPEVSKGVGGARRNAVRLCCIQNCTRTAIISTCYNMTTSTSQAIARTLVCISSRSFAHSALCCAATSRIRFCPSTISSSSFWRAIFKSPFNCSFSTCNRRMFHQHLSLSNVVQKRRRSCKKSEPKSESFAAAYLPKSLSFFAYLAAEQIPVSGIPRRPIAEM